MSSTLWTLILSIGLSGCGGKEPVDNPSVFINSPCESLNESLCAFPYPSSFFQRQDTTSPTGYRLAFPNGVLPTINTRAADPQFWNERDGFSPLTPVLTHFQDVSLEGVVGHQNLADYLADDVKTVLWDVESGERIPHFVELDMRHEDDQRRAFTIRPVRPIPWGHRVVVGIRNLETLDGDKMQPSPTFADLRDQTTDSDYDLTDRQIHFDTLIFPELERTGFQRGELQLAWDFVVSSKEGTTGKLIQMRDDALSHFDNQETDYNIVFDQQYDLQENPYIARHIEGTLNIPYYTELPEPGQVLSRDVNNLPMFMGMRERPFTLLIPHSVYEDTEPAPIIQYGHGLLGSQEEVLDEAITSVAHEMGAILLATDWAGLCSEDLNYVSTMLVNDLDRFAMVPERSQQGFIDALMALNIVQRDIAQSALFQRTDGSRLINSEQVYFYGNSMGSIFGLPYVAMNPQIDRAVLGVAGSTFSLLLPRSLNFGTFYGLLQNLYPDQLETALWLGLLQTLWDSGEASGYLDSVSIDPLSSNDAKSLLVQTGIGDAQVHTLGAHILMRGVAGGLIANPNREVWGLDVLTDGQIGTGMVEWDYGMTEPAENVPPIRQQNIDVHRSVREEEPAKQQLIHFLETGELVNFCDGPCISENGLVE